MGLSTRLADGGHDLIARGLIGRVIDDDGDTLRSEAVRCSRAHTFGRAGHDGRF